jgi:citrate lyase subunit beta/citryl-CoA lyase
MSGHRSQVARSYLYVPGDRAAVLAKAAGRGADALIIDLEDAVPLAGKAQARQLVAAWLGAPATAPGPAPQVWVRVNRVSAESGAMTAADLRGVAAECVAGFLVAKTEDAGQLGYVGQLLTALEAGLGLPEEHFKLVPLIESARGLSAAAALASAPRVVRLQLGEADLAADLGLIPAGDEVELLPARSSIVQVSAAVGLAAPAGSACVDIADLARLEETTQRLRRLGFAGRSVIHPAQIPVVNRIFTPTPEEVGRASRVLAAFERAQRAGSAVAVDDDGRMVDAAVVRAAQRVLALAAGQPGVDVPTSPMIE